MSIVRFLGRLWALAWCQSEGICLTYPRYTSTSEKSGKSLVFVRSWPRTFWRGSLQCLVSGVDRLVILVAVVLVVSGGSFAWSKSGLNVATARSDATTATPPAHIPLAKPAPADYRAWTAPTLIAAAAKLDQQVNKAYRPPRPTSIEPPSRLRRRASATPTESDEVPNPVAPATTRASAASNPGGSCRRR